MQRYRISILIALLLPFALAAQTTTTAPSQAPLRGWGWGFNFGMVGYAPTTTTLFEGNAYSTQTYSTGIGRARNNEGKKRFIVITNSSFGLHGGYTWEDKSRKGTTGIMAEIQRNKATYIFNPPFTYSFKGDTAARWIQMLKYYKFALAMERSFRLNKISTIPGQGEAHLFIREAFGYSIQSKSAVTAPVLGGEEDWTENGTGRKTKTLIYNRQSYILSSEIGLRRFTESKNRSFDMSIAYHQPFSKTLVEEVIYYKNGASVGKTNITFGGSTIMVNLRYTFTPIPKPKPVEPEPEPEPQPEPVVIAKDTNDRAVDVQSRFSAKGSKTIKIRVWDRDEVDGDEISLYLNGELITSHLPLKKHKKRFKLHLDPGKNYLVMKAENLGTIPPNTAAFELKNGRNKRNITLTSDEGKSGAVEITR